MHRRTLLQLTAVLAGCAPVEPRSKPDKPSFSRRMVELEPKDPAALGIDEVAFARLRERCEASGSDATVVLVGNAVAADWTFVPPAEPIGLADVTQSIVALAVAKTIDLGFVSGLDEKLSTFFPAFAHDPGKAGITVRHVLAHASGLDDVSLADLRESEDPAKSAAAAPSRRPPGTAFAFARAPMQLLARMVRIASKKPIDEIAAEHVLAPLGIDDFVWERDRSNEPVAYAGLSMRAMDVAKLGLLLVSGGVWAGRRVVDEAFVVQATHPVSEAIGHGLGFAMLDDVVHTVDDALLAAWTSGGLPTEFVDRMRPLLGRRIPARDLPATLVEALGPGGEEIYAINTTRRGLPGLTVVERTNVGFRSEGAGGEHLVVYPAESLIGVRLRRSPEPGASESADASLAAFPSLLRGILPAKPA